MAAILIAGTLAVAAPSTAAPAAAATAWNVGVLAPTVTGAAHAQFTDVSCPASNFCMAVGTDIAPLGFSVALVETWNGRTWRLVTNPGPGSGARRLTSVSCASSSFCAAAAGAVRGHLLLWNGHTWRLSALPDATGAVNDVQCRTASNCMAVGRVNKQAVTWHRSGSRWHRVVVTSPYRSSLVAVSCPSATVCYAAGTISVTDDVARPSVQRWNGRTWTSATLGKTFGALSDISCPTTTRCTAVGWRGQTDDGTLVADLTSTTWRYSTPGTKADDSVNRVSCTVAGVCTVLITTSTDAIVNRIAVRSGAGSFVRATKDYPDLEGLACTGQSCTVVGSTVVSDRDAPNIASTRTPATVYRRAGTALQSQAVPQPPAGVDLSLSQVSCVGAGYCAAVGTSDFAGALFTRATPARPWAHVEGVTGDLTDVWCTSDTFCMATGRGRSASWNGAKWTTHPVPTPNGAGRDNLSGVTCVSATWCDAVGTTGGQTTFGKVFIVHWNGSTWTTVNAPTPAAQSYWTLAAISCTATDACLAVGNNTDGEPLVERWNGTTWTMTGHSGLPDDAGLTDVSCWGATGCMVTSPDLGSSVGVVATWNGTAFTAHPVRNTQEPQIDSVSCRSAQSCVAVGLSNADFLQLIEFWNGSRWTRIASRAVNGDQPELTGVSCLAADGLCTAVGAVAHAYSVGLVATGRVGSA